MRSTVAGRWHDWAVEALHGFDQAMTLRPAGNDDAVLRWNACVAAGAPAGAGGRSARAPAITSE
jgi:hypothetical protein